MPIKLVLDGALLSECEMSGSNRYGMIRIAEDLTNELIKSETLEIKFINSIYSSNYDKLLKKFILTNHPSHINSILSKKPLFSSNIPKLKGLFNHISNYLDLQIKQVDIEKNDVFHSFYYPFPKNIKETNIKKSITYLDIIPLKLSGYTELFINKTKRIVNDIKSNFAISISEFSKQDLMDYDNEIDPDRVFVSYLAASNDLFFQNRNIEEWERVRRKYNLPNNYFLIVSSTDLRKNVSHLIKSFSKYFLQQKPDDLFLVVVGNSNFSNSLLEELNIDKQVREHIFISERYIEDKDLSVIYSNALCFFFMSLYEGFGLPALEAMQCGVPVVTSNTTSLPEVVGDAGIMLDPNDEDALCEVMNKMYLSEDLRNKYSKLGLERAKQFSWERCANEYAEIFKKIAYDF